MNNQPARSMLQHAIKAFIATAIKIVALTVAWFLEIAGKILFKMSDMIKHRAK